MAVHSLQVTQGSIRYRRGEMIDKKNKLWKWKKADKKFKDQYRKMCGLEADEVGIMTDKGFNLYYKLLSGLQPKKT